MNNKIDIRYDFQQTFKSLVDSLINCSDVADMQETNNWLEQIFDYNVPHGKLTRGLTTALAYSVLSKDLCEKNVQLSYILGWCLEILHSAFLIGDDIMDGSETRRGRSCWYKVENNGVAAFNDTILLESAMYKVLKLNFKSKSYYIELLEIFHDTLLKTVYGQSLDTRTSSQRNFEMYNMDLYKKIVKYKTSYYTFYTPIRLAMAMAEISDLQQIEEVKSVAFELGLLFQVQDDYLDCFGDCEITGKIGTDIQDGKCTWLYVTAMEKANSEHRAILKELYGKEDYENIKVVKNLYIELGIDKMLQCFEEKMYSKISSKIDTFDVEMYLLKDTFRQLLNQIYKRAK